MAYELLGTVKNTRLIFSDGKVVEDVSMPTRVAYNSLIFHVPSMPTKPLLLICNEWQTY